MDLGKKKDKILFLLFIQEIQLVYSLCSGSGFPAEWTTATPGVTYWYVTPLIKRQFGPKYEFRDIFTDTGNVCGPPPECQSEYYDPTTGYYYYLMYYTKENIYSPDTNRQICHGFKQYDSVIREYYEDLGFPGVLTEAKECFLRLAKTTQSFALTKYNFIYVDCPFSNEEYYFTFSVDKTEDYCSGQMSSAFIDYQTISLKSCYDPGLVNTVEAGRDTPDGGDFIVVEMYDGVQWPYCGRYKVDANGVITMSLYLSMSADDWFPVWCAGSVDNTFIYDDGVNIFTRLVFKPVMPRSIIDFASTSPVIVIDYSPIITTIQPTTSITYTTTKPTTRNITTTTPTTTTTQSTTPTTTTTTPNTTTTQSTTIPTTTTTTQPATTTTLTATTTQSTTTPTPTTTTQPSTTTTPTTTTAQSTTPTTTTTTLPSTTTTPTTTTTQTTTPTTTTTTQPSTTTTPTATTTQTTTLTPSTTTQPSTTPPPATTTTQTTTTPTPTTITQPSTTTTPTTTTAQSTTPATTTTTLPSTTTTPTTTTTLPSTTTTPTTTTTQSTTTPTTTTTSQPSTTTTITTTTAQPTTTTAPTTIAIGNSTTTLSSSVWDDIANLDWPWWILIGGSVVLLTTLACCTLYAGLRRRGNMSKVENLKHTEVQNLNKKSVGISNQPPADHAISTQPKRPKVQLIQVKKFTQPKWTR